MVKLQEIKEIAKEVLGKETYLEQKNGVFTYEAYADYTDALDEETTKEILDKDSVGERYEIFYDKMYDVYNDYIDETLSEFKVKILDYIEENYPDIDYYEAQDVLNESIQDIITIEIPESHYLDVNLCANLILDTGDANYDFGINTLDTIRENGLLKESSILWVAKSQGYNKEQTEKAIIEDEYNDSKFLKSLSEEVLNAHYMNAFTFLIECTLRQLMDFDKDKLKSITVNKSSNCGLVDFWYGAGGMLDIELEKDIEIPIDIIDSFTIDGGRGTYSIDSIYGMASDAWNGSVKYNLK